MHDVIDLRTEHQANRLKQQSPALELWMLLQGFQAEVPEKINLLQLLKCQKAGTHAIVNIMRVVGNFIGQISQLRFQAGLPPWFGVPWLLDKTPCYTTGLTRFNVLRVTPGAVLQNAFARFKGQVKPVVVRVALFQRINHAQALKVVLKTGTVRVVTFQAIIEGVLPGVAIGGMPKIMGQRNGFHQVFVQIQGAGYGPPQLGDFQ